jgi:hypothetical protein
MFSPLNVQRKSQSITAPAPNMMYIITAPAPNMMYILLSQTSTLHKHLATFFANTTIYIPTLEQE